TAESALPVNRVSVSYGYFDSFKVANSAGGGTMPGFNLHRFDLAAELTFLEGQGSFYARVPFLNATANAANAPIDGFGDVSAGIKFALLYDKETRTALTAGLTVAAPTARDLVVTTV